MKNCTSVRVEFQPLMDEDERVAKAVRQNELAMLSFAMAFTNDGLMNMIHSACTEEWSEGQTYLVAQEILK
jgi:hypothetical protein